MVGGLGDRVLFGMGTETFVESSATRGKIVAARAAAFVAVRCATRRAVVARRNDSLVQGHDRRDLSLHAVAAGSDDPGDAQEIVIPSGAGEAKIRPYPGLNLLLELNEVAIVREREIRLGFDRIELLRIRIVAAPLLALQDLEGVELRRISDASARHHPFEPGFEFRIHPHEMKRVTGRGGVLPQNLHLDGMPNRVDRVVSIRQEMPRQTLSQRARPGFAAHFATGFDHPLPGFLEAATREFLSDRIR